MHARDRLGSRRASQPPSRGVVKRHGSTGSSSTSSSLTLRAMPCQAALRGPDFKSLGQRADERLIGRRVQCPANLSADIEMAMLGVGAASEGVVTAAAGGRCCVRFDDGTLEAFSHRGQEQWHPAASVRRWLMPAVDSLSDALGAMSTATSVSAPCDELSNALGSLATTAARDASMIAAVEQQLGCLPPVSADEPDMSSVQHNLDGLSIVVERRGSRRRGPSRSGAPHHLRSSVWSPPHAPPAPQPRPPRPPPPRPAPPPTPPPALPIGEALALAALQQSAFVVQKPVPVSVAPPAALDVTLDHLQLGGAQDGAPQAWGHGGCY
jgi:hypothetical protein